MGALIVQLALGGLLLWQASRGFDLVLPDRARGVERAPVTAVTPSVPTPKVDAFDAPAALALARRQVALGPRPAGSDAQRAAATFLQPLLPGGRFVPIAGGLRNIEGSLPGQGRPILLIAHYDTTPVPGYLGAENSAAAVGAVVEIARALERDHPRAGARPVRFLLTDGEEAPTYPVSGDFTTQGLRGSRAAAKTITPSSVIVMDFVGQKDLRIPRELGSDAELWGKLRAVAQRIGTIRVFPDTTRGVVLDDHTPFTARGIPGIDLIDFSYPCWQRTCDTLDKLSVRSLDASGETVLELIRTLR